MGGQLVWLGVAGSLIGMAFGYLVHAFARPPAEEVARRRSDYAALRTVAILASALAVAFFAVTIIPWRPFAPGMGLGVGFLIGTGAALFASPFALRGDGPLHRAASTAALAAWALIGACVLVIVFRDILLAASLGFALGTLLVCGLLRMGLGQAADERGDWFAMEAYAVWALTLGTMLAIATFRSHSYEMNVGLPLGVAGTVLIASVIGARVLTGEEADRRPGRALALAAAAASAIVLAVIALLAWRAYEDWTPLWVAMCGAGAAAIGAWLLISSDRDALVRTRSAALGIFVVLIAMVVCFRLLGAYGIGIALIVAWAIGLAMAQVTLPGERGGGDRLPPRTLIRMLAFGLAFMLYRLFIERYRDQVSHADLRTHYTTIGTLMGVMLPLVVASWRAGWAASGETRKSALGRAMGVAFVASLVPVVLTLVWGMKATLGLLGGVVAAQILLALLPLLNGMGPLLARSWNMTALGVATVGVVFCEPTRNWLILARAQKIYVAVAIGVVVAVWALVAGALGRRARSAGAQVS